MEDKLHIELSSYELALLMMALTQATETWHGDTKEDAESLRDSIADKFYFKSKVK